MISLHRLLLALVFPAAFALTLGCGPATKSTERPATSSTPAVSLKILDYEGIQKLIASHKGKVVVMDCWSTSCGPCIQEFPKLVALHKQHGAEKVACISLSFDYEGIGKPEDVQPDVLKFLEKQQATFDNVLASEESDALYKKMNLAAIPAVYVFDREGKLSKRFEGGEAYGEVPQLVETLIAK
jgi:thiol-disulfide isomerase/thioredoxin